jgi:hypothetical protein
VTDTPTYEPTPRPTIASPISSPTKAPVTAKPSYEPTPRPTFRKLSKFENCQSGSSQHRQKILQYNSSSHSLNQFRPFVLQLPNRQQVRRFTNQVSVQLVETLLHIMA